MSELQCSEAVTWDVRPFIDGRYQRSGSSQSIDNLNPAALKRLLSSGTQLRAFPQDVMEACYKSANDVYAELSKTNPMFKKMLDSLVPFRSDSYLWTQVAEMGFDNFMVRMRTRS